MTIVEIGYLAGAALVVLALLVPVGFYVASRVERRADELEQARPAQWVSEQDRQARATMPARAVASPRPGSLDDGETRALRVPARCGSTSEHASHSFIEYLENGTTEPDMRRTLCHGFRTGPRRAAG